MNSSAADNLAASASGSSRFAAGKPDAAAPHEARPEYNVLLVGYGNLLRSDDGVGPAIVSRLAASFLENRKCMFMTPHQLTPEVAEDIVHAERVLFIDASLELPPGKIQVRRLSWEGPSNGRPLGHHVSPQSILALAQSLFGSTPRAWSVAVGVANLSVGDRLSPAVSRSAQRLCRHLAYCIRRWCQCPPANIHSTHQNTRAPDLAASVSRQPGSGAPSHPQPAFNGGYVRRSS
jgi:hydrogenase maturation protease